MYKIYAFTQNSLVYDLFDDIDCFYNKVKCRKIVKLMPTLSKLEVAEQKFL